MKREGDSPLYQARCLVPPYPCPRALLQTIWHKTVHPFRFHIFVAARVAAALYGCGDARAAGSKARAVAYLKSVVVSSLAHNGGKTNVKSVEVSPCTGAGDSVGRLSSMYALEGGPRKEIGIMEEAIVCSG